MPDNRHYYIRCSYCGVVSSFNREGKRSSIPLEEATAVILSGKYSRGRCSDCLQKFFGESFREGQRKAAESLNVDRDGGL